MKKILFLIHDLGQGGAERVLVNLVNNLDRTIFDISVVVLFGGGIMESCLKPDIKFHAVFPRMIPANSKWMKLLSPEQLHRLCVKDRYDIEVAYLEGPSARVISGCDNSETKLVAWIHSSFFSMKDASASFRNEYETVECYSRFHRIVGVSDQVVDYFCKWVPLHEKCMVLYNTIESEIILLQAQEPVSEIINRDCFNMITAGRLKQVKGFDRLLRIVKQLKEHGKKIHLYILGHGPMEDELKHFIIQNDLYSEVSLLGYHVNPYKYMSKCDLFVCSSYSEGFSTAVTEALIVGIPVCTVDVSGMKELLGRNNEYGLITENNEEALYEGISLLIDDENLLAAYKTKAVDRGKSFSKDETVRAVEEMLLSL